MQPDGADQGIKILQVDGLGGGGGRRGEGFEGGGGNIADNLVNSALRYETSTPSYCLFPFQDVYPFRKTGPEPV